ncbi:HAD family hydrolase [Siminovitchia acidinfaciens]|uniref:HAD family hydrolase n=1 Tax=Siminovitchia acidinfaciens TaxID=2321395 RepID=A0A429XWF5_9BACI|nr:HAD family hydrolase [Siminovitchia acidinfaciens]RST72723.1 HAD family hydrolase [Siminovitchia acidinfaciens]
MIKGILFDKDGTLVEFNTLWINSTYSVIYELVKQYALGDYVGKTNKIAHFIGLKGNEVDENSLLAGKTSKDISKVIADSLHADQEKIHKEMNGLYYRYVQEHSEDIKAIGNLAALFKQLKKNQLKIGIVTADNFDVTMLTITELGIRKYIDFIGTADLYEKKPSREAMEVFCYAHSLKPDEVIHVGDTPVDMEFSKHGRFGVGVLSGVGSEETLRKYTPHIVESVQDLIDNKGNFIYSDSLLELQAY